MLNGVTFADSQRVSAAGGRKDSMTAGGKDLALHYGSKEEDLTST